MILRQKKFDKRNSKNESLTKKCVDTLKLIFLDNILKVAHFNHALISFNNYSLVSLNNYICQPLQIYKKFYEKLAIIYYHIILQWYILFIKIKCCVWLGWMKVEGMKWDLNYNL